MNEPGFVYAIGGSLPADSPTYVVRQVDHDLAAALRAGQLCSILSPRQMGKSSLKVRAMEQLRANGIACADIDLTLIGTEEIPADQWFAGVYDIIAGSLGLNPEPDPASWWHDRSWLPPAHRLAKFFEDVLFVHVPGEIVLFFDEVDSLLGLPFGDDFFALLRGCHEQRATRPEYGRLTAVLIGVATPAELIRDPRRSPFNIGRAIHLEGFRFDEARDALLPGLARLADPAAVLREVLAWTGGQPFLTQKLCELAGASPSAPAAGEEAAWMESLVRARVLESWEAQDKPVHLHTIRDRILRSGSRRTAQLLRLYQEVLQGDETPGDDSPEAIELRLSGLVVARQRKLAVTNRIYASIFDLAWVDRELAKLRPYAAALAAWLASGRTDASQLPRGPELEAVRRWAGDRRLSDEDHAYIAAGEELERHRIEADLAAERKANELLRIARKKAGLWTAFAAAAAMLIIGLALFSSRATVQQAQKSRRDAENAQRNLDREVQRKNSELEAKEHSLQKGQAQLQALESSFRAEQVRGTAASFAAAIGHDPEWIPPEEMAIFQTIARDPDQVRLEFLRQALASSDGARRLSRRLALAGHAVVGLSPERRQRLLQEVVLPCLRSTADLQIRRVCADLGTQSRAASPELTKLVSGLSPGALDTALPLPGQRVAFARAPDEPTLAGAELLSPAKRTFESSTPPTDGAVRAEDPVKRALWAATDPRQVASLIGALSVFPATLSRDDSKAVKAMFIDHLWEHDREDLFQSAELISHRFDPETAREMAQQVAAGVAAMDRRLLQWKSRGDEQWSRIAGRFSKASELLAALPAGTDMTGAMEELKPVLVGAMFCNVHASCETIRSAFARIPAELDRSFAVNFANGYDEHFMCSDENGRVFAEIVHKVKKESQRDLAKDLLARLASPRIDWQSCMVKGLGAQQADLSLEEIDRIFGLLPSGDVWVAIASKIAAAEADRALETYASRLERGPIERDLVTKSLPGMAARVVPEKSRQAFARLVRITAFSSRAEVDQALAASILALPGKVPPRDLIDFLAQPQCVGVLRKAALTRLERQTGRRFEGDIWAAAASVRGNRVP